MSATGPWAESLFTGWLSGKTVKAMLLTSSYSQDVDVSTVPTAFEVSGTGYTAGGLTVTSHLSISYDSTAHAVRLECTDIDYGTVDLPDVGAVAFYAGSVLIAVDTLPSPVEVSNRAFTYRPGASGLVQASIA